MNYKELSYAFKKIMSWYKKKTKVLNIKSRPYNTGFVFFDLISRLINDNKKVLYVFSVDSNEINGKNHSELVDKEELNLFLTSLVHLHYLLFSP